MTEDAVVFSGVTKRFGDLVALDNIDLQVHRGEILGLLGPNGAGKSTLTNIATGILHADLGTVQILGHDIQQDSEVARKSLGIVPQDILLYDHLTAIENLMFFAIMNGLVGREARERVNTLVKYIDLDSDALNREVSTLSGGMKRRVNIACGILHDPQVIFLDEPTAGLDPSNRISLWRLIRKLKESGKTVVLTTHLMDEAEELCDRIAIMDRGRIVTIDTPHSLLSQIRTREAIELYTQENPVAMKDEYLKIEGVQSVTAEVDAKTNETYLRILVEGANEILPELIRATFDLGMKIRRVHVTAPSLADVFLHFTGRMLTENSEQSETSMEVA